MLWQQVLLAIAAGMLLNLTPCVLPVLPIKLRSIGRVVGTQPRQRLLAGLALLAGTLTFFGALAIATAALNWTWGTLFQSMTFRLALTGLLAVFGIASLAGRGLQPPQWAARVAGNGYTEPYFVGLLAAILSTPCTGPFLGGVLAFALTQSPATIVTIFLAVGIGLALPYLVCLAIPGLIGRTPRAGAWLLRIQQAMGLVLLGGAVFFLATAVPARFTPLLWIIWAAVVAFWLIRSLLSGPDLKARAVPCVVAIVMVVAASITMAGNGSTHGLGWEPLNTATLATAKRSDQPVLIEFTADWCINCKVLEHTVYNNPRVLEAARHADLVTLRADLTRPDAQLQHTLRRLGGAGLPYAVILGRDGRIAHELPDLFTADALVSAIKGVTP